MRGVISDDAPLIVELENTLQEISAMSRSFRQMADYLEQHPEALIRGKGNLELEGNNMRVAPVSRGLPVILAIAAIFLGGCRSQSPRFYTLSPIQEDQEISKRKARLKTRLSASAPSSWPITSTSRCWSPARATIRR